MRDRHTLMLQLMEHAAAASARGMLAGASNWGAYMAEHLAPTLDEPVSPPAGDAAPDGWKLVPVNPSEDMVSKANRTAKLDATGAWHLDAITAYYTMLAAAPAAPAQPTEGPSPELLRLNQAGSVLSNLAFNLARLSGERLHERTATLLSKAQIDWDAACAAFKAARAALAAAPVAEPAWPKDLPIRIQVGYWPKAWDTFIYAVSGHLTVEMLTAIEAQIRTDDEGLFDKGPGDYLLSAIFDKGQYSPEGRCEWAPGWELSVERFRPAEQDTPTPGMQSK